MTSPESILIQNSDKTNQKTGLPTQNFAHNSYRANHLSILTQNLDNADSPETFGITKLFLSSFRD